MGDNTSSESNKLKYLKIIIQVAAATVVLMHLVFIYFKIVVIRPFPLAEQISIDVFKYFQMPTMWIFFAISFYKRLKGQVFRLFVKFEFWLLALSIFTFVLYFALPAID